jgi:hypothetical protein
MNGLCVECPSNPVLLVCTFLVGALLCGGFAYYLNKRKVHLGILSIGVDYFQVWLESPLLAMHKYSCVVPKSSGCAL